MPFQTLVNKWLYAELYGEHKFKVEEEVRYVFGEPFTSIKLTRDDNPEYYIILEPLENN